MFSAKLFIFALIIGASNGWSQGPQLTQISSGNDHTCATTADGGIACWGVNYEQQITPSYSMGGLLNRDLEIFPLAVNFRFQSSVIRVSLGGRFTCALRAQGSVSCWGDSFDTYYAPTQAETVIPLGPDFKAVNLTTGSDHVCALSNQGQVKCWGVNSYGQAGSNKGPYIFPQLEGQIANINFGINTTAKAISAGGTHTCAALSTGVIKCWGSNLRGELGYDPVQLKGRLKKQYMYGEDLGDIPQLPGVSLGIEGMAIQSLTAGSSHNCVLLTNGLAKCWGRNSDGVLGISDQRDRGGSESAKLMGPNLPYFQTPKNQTIRSIHAGPNDTCAILADNSVYCRGSQFSGLIPMPDGSQPVQLTIGRAHACVLLADHKVLCWGSGKLGQLGNGELKDSQTPVPVQFK